MSRPVVEMTADRAFVFKATRIFGSGPVMLLIVGVGMTEEEVAATGHTDSTLLGRLPSEEPCCANTSEEKND